MFADRMCRRMVPTGMAVLAASVALADRTGLFLPPLDSLPAQVYRQNSVAHIPPDSFVHRLNLAPLVWLRSHPGRSWLAGVAQMATLAKAIAVVQVLDRTEANWREMVMVPPDHTERSEAEHQIERHCRYMNQLETAFLACSC